jgi:hypothetical protein
MGSVHEKGRMAERPPEVCGRLTPVSFVARRSTIRRTFASFASAPSSTYPYTDGAGAPNGLSMFHSGAGVLTEQDLVFGAPSQLHSEKQPPIKQLLPFRLEPRICELTPATKMRYHRQPTLATCAEIS